MLVLVLVLVLVLEENGKVARLRQDFGGQRDKVRDSRWGWFVPSVNSGTDAVFRGGKRGD